MEGQPILGQPAADDLKGLTELLGSGGEVDAVEPDLDRRNAAPHPIQKAPAAHLVEHADLIDQPQRVIERQQIDHRPKAQLPGPLRDGGQEHSGRRCIAERRVVVFGEMIAIETRTVVGLNKLEPLFEMLV